MENRKKTVEEIKQELLDKLSSGFGVGLEEATDEQIYEALARMIRDEVLQRRAAMRGIRQKSGAKKVYYLSA